MTFDKALRLSGEVVPEDVAHACRLLESHGFRFNREFHVGDAITAAGALLIELEEEPKEEET